MSYRDDVDVDRKIRHLNLLVTAILDHLHVYVSYQDAQQIPEKYVIIDKSKGTSK